jgi:hypothetical protein
MKRGRVEVKASCRTLPAGHAGRHCPSVAVRPRAGCQRDLVEAETTVHADYGSVDIGRGWRQQEGDDRCELVGRGKPSKWDALHKCPADCGRKAIHIGRGDQAGQDCVAGDPGARPFDSKGSHQAEQACFAGSIRDLTRLTKLGGNRRHEHNTTARRLEKIRVCGLSRTKRARQIDFDFALPVRSRESPGAVEIIGHGCVRDDRIDTAEFSGALGHYSLHRDPVGNVDSIVVDPSQAEQGPAFEIHVKRGNFTVELKQPLAKRRADPSGGTGNHDLETRRFSSQNCWHRAGVYNPAVQPAGVQTG